MDKKTLNIFGNKIKISIEDIGTEDAGRYYEKLNLIKIAPHLKGDDLMHTLLHEVGHAILVRTGVRQAIEDQVHEVIVENMATALLENFDIKLKK